MQRKDLALRVLSTAAIMSIVTSIAAPAFAGTYYIGKGSIDVEATTRDGKQYVKVTQGGTTYEEDESNEIVIKDGTDENDTTLKDADRAAATPAADPAAGAATQELEATGSADAAGEGQPDPDDAFTLNETGEDSAQTQQGKDTTENPTEDTPKDPSTDNPTEPPKKDVVYEYAPADPNPEQQATKLAPTTSADPTAKTKEATQANAPAAAPTTPTAPAANPPAEDSTKTPTANVIKVVNNWVSDTAKELKIRLSNVNIKTIAHYNPQDYKAAMTVSGSGNTKIELDGNNVLDSTETYNNPSYMGGFAGLNKQGEGTLTITDEKTDDGQLRTTKKDENDKTGTLTAAGGINAAGIGGNARYEAGNAANTQSCVNNIVIEGYANVTAISGKDSGFQSGSAGIGGGDCQSADNIIIRGNANVTAKSTNGFGAAIGGGRQGSATNVKIYENANVTAIADAKGEHSPAAIGTGHGGLEADVTIGSDGQNQDKEKTVVKTKSPYVGIGAVSYSGYNYKVTANVTIQGGATVESESSGGPAIGAYGGGATIVIKDHAHIKKATTTNSDFVAIGGLAAGDKDVSVTVQDNAKLDEVGWIGGTGGNEVKVTVKDSAEITDIGQIGGGDDTQKTTVNILNNAVIKKLTGIIGNVYERNGTSVTIDGGDNGKVKINENALGNGKIAGKNLKIGNNVLIKLGADNSSAKPAADIDDDTLKANIKDHKSAEIWYTNVSGALYKIIHSEDLCKKGSTKTIIQQPTCTTPGLAEYTCDYEHGATNPSCHRTWQETIPIDPNAHDWGDWEVTTHATCTTTGVKTRYCNRDHNHVDTQTIPIDPNAHNWGDWTVDVAPTCTTEGKKSHHCTRCDAITDVTVLPATGHQWHSDNDATHSCERGDKTEAHSYSEWTIVTPATCTTAGEKKHTCSVCGHVETQEIPATGHHWKDNGDGTHTCPDCGATEGQPSNTNSALELRVVDAEGMDQPFTVSQNGTLRTYTGAYDTATLTGDLDTLRYLQDHGAQTIQFVTNGQTSSFAINDLLAQGSGSEVFYLTHRGAEEPTLLLVEADHSELVKD